MRRRRARGPRSDPLHEETGQSTTEYAIVFVAFLAMVVALGLVWNAAHDGAFVDAAEEHSDHRLALGVPEIGNFGKDLFMF